LILLSGVHFQGNWKNVFNKTFTKNEPFYDEAQERVIGRVNMMFQRGPFAYAANRNLGCYLLELPYGADRDLANRNNLPEGSDDRISMIVVLPKRGLSLLDAINNVNMYGLKSILVELKKAKEEFDDEEVEVHIPRFEMETSLNLAPTLDEVRHAYQSIT
jgi:serine protease inhibitor